MWPLPRLRHELVTISLTPEALVCGWIKKTHAPPYTCAAYTHTPLENLECAQGIIYNPTRIAQHITLFLQEHALQNAFIALAVSGEHVLQRLVSLPISTPKKEYVTLPELENMRWDYRYLHPNPDGTFTFYVYGLTQEQLFQYKLLAITAKLNLISIMPSWAAHLQTYKQLHGTAFSHSALAADMRTAGKIEKLVSPDQIKKRCAGTPNDAKELACLLGLFTAGNNL